MQHDTRRLLDGLGDNVIGSRINWNTYDNGNGLTLVLVNGLADGLSVGEMLEFSYELTAQGVELEETLGLAVDLQMNFSGRDILRWAHSGSGRDSYTSTAKS